MALTASAAPAKVPSASVILTPVELTTMLTIFPAGTNVPLDFRWFAVIIPGTYQPSSEDIRPLKPEMERDGFAADGTLSTIKALGKMSFAVENRTANSHRTGVRLSFPVHPKYDLLRDGKPVLLVQTGNWDYPWRAELAMSGPSSRIELVPKPF